MRPIEDSILSLAETQHNKKLFDIVTRLRLVNESFLLSRICWRSRRGKKKITWGGKRITNRSWKKGRRNNNKRKQQDRCLSCGSRAADRESSFLMRLPDEGIWPTARARSTHWHRLLNRQLLRHGHRKSLIKKYGGGQHEMKTKTRNKDKQRDYNRQNMLPTRSKTNRKWPRPAIALGFHAALASILLQFRKLSSPLGLLQAAHISPYNHTIRRALIMKIKL